MKKKTERTENDRTMMERLEQQRIDFERRARMARTNLYNTVPPRDPPPGWIDANRK